MSTWPGPKETEFFLGGVFPHYVGIIGVTGRAGVGARFYRLPDLQRHETTLKFVIAGVKGAISAVPGGVGVSGPVSAGRALV